jgi:hypothetical protein
MPLFSPLWHHGPCCGIPHRCQRRNHNAWRLEGTWEDKGSGLGRTRGQVLGGQGVRSCIATQPLCSLTSLIRIHVRRSISVMINLILLPMCVLQTASFAERAEGQVLNDKLPCSPSYRVRRRPVHTTGVAPSQVTPVSRSLASIGTSFPSYPSSRLTPYLCSGQA